MNRRTISRRMFLRKSGFAMGVALATRSIHGYAAASAKKIASFQCDVTPPLGTPIYSSYEPLKVIETPLLAKGIILEQNGERFVLCAVDYCELCNSTHTLFQQVLATAVGTTVDKVAVQTVHQHTAPMADADANAFLEKMQNPPPFAASSTFTEAAERLGLAAKKAAESLQPYNQVGTSQAQVERVASNRRVPIGDGKVGFRASSCIDPKMIELPEGIIDPFVKTITFAQDGKPIARLHYYATHPQSFYGDPRASYDFVGMAREELQKREGIFQVYFTGCSGDIAAGKYNNRTPEAREGLYQRLLQGMENAAATTKYLEAPDIRWTTTPLALTPRSDGEFAEAECYKVMANEKAVGSVRGTGSMILAWQQRVATPVILSALHMGNISILHLPGEPMIAFQLHAQQESPDRFVAVAGYGDCGMGYICVKSAYPEGGYEPTASFVVPESEDLLRAAINALLAGAKG